MSGKGMVCCTCIHGKDKRCKGSSSSSSLRVTAAVMVCVALLAGLVIRIELVNNRLVAVEEEIHDHSHRENREPDAAKRSPVDRDVVDRDAVYRDAVDRYAADRDAYDRDAVYKDAVDRDAVVRDAVYRNAVDRDAVYRDAVDKDAIDKYAVYRDAAARVRRTSNPANDPVSNNKALTQELKRFVLNLTASSFCQLPSKVCVAGPSGKPGGRGPRGRRGRRGPRGSKGQRGSQGILGPPGRHGKQGIMGRSGNKGEKGDKGLPGARGLPGLKGDPGESISKPTVVLSPPLLTISENQTAIVHCTAHGNPRPEVTWRRVNGKNNRWRPRRQGGEFVILDSKLRDAGEYWCEAKNILGTARTRMQLLVEAPPRLTVYPLRRTKTHQGSITRLTCKAVGYPQPVIEWTRVFALPAGRRVVTNGTLTITDTDISDVGLYTCKAKNKLGTAQAVTILVVTQVSMPPTRDPSTIFPTTHVNSPECTTYTPLSDANRNINSKKTANLCDRGLVTRWYRITGSAGSILASSCVPKNKCQTSATGWLNGNLPSTGDGIVTRQVCFNWDGNCCNWNVNIRVRNCGPYYVYELKKPPNCSLRYCTQ